MSDYLDYSQAQHAMQTGVSMIMQYSPTETEPKHLRVGINTAMCDHAALVRLLIEKGIITNDEYMAAVTKEMNQEVQRYHERLQRYLGGGPAGIELR